MPALSKDAIVSSIAGKSFSVEGDFPTKFKEDGDFKFLQKLGAAMNAGWTSKSPTTPTTMAAEFDGEFADYLSGQGKDFVSCIATGIDQEIASWVSSWNPTLGIHTYTVAASNIVSKIQACAPLWSNGAKALAEAAADAFMSGFGQEAG